MKKSKMENFTFCDRSEMWRKQKWVHFPLSLLLSQTLLNYTTEAPRKGKIDEHIERLHAQLNREVPGKTTQLSIEKIFVLMEIYCSVITPHEK